VVVLGYCSAYYHHFGFGVGYFLRNTKEVSKVRLFDFKRNHSSTSYTNRIVGPSKWLLASSLIDTHGVVEERARVVYVLSCCGCCSWI
jgi:hypothetical protein